MIKDYVEAKERLNFKRNSWTAQKKLKNRIAIEPIDKNKNLNINGLNLILKTLRA